MTVDGYLGGGVRFDTRKGFMLRFDARLSFVPGVDMSTGDGVVALEANFVVGVQFAPGKKRPHDTETVEPSATADRDGDGIVDAKDKCPDDPEDKDGYEDQDGCPDIDNDGDKVLDALDKCPTELETMNGFEDEDGIRIPSPPTSKLSRARSLASCTPRARPRCATPRRKI
jgi:hypothetical protein